MTIGNEDGPDRHRIGGMGGDDRDRYLPGSYPPNLVTSIKVTRLVNGSHRNRPPKTGMRSREGSKPPSRG